MNDVVRQDELFVRTFTKEARNDQGDRVVIDLNEDATTDRFIVLDQDGGSVHLGFERVSLSWEALLQLADLIRTGNKTLRLKGHVR